MSLTKPIDDCVLARESKAFSATFMNTGSPVSMLKVPNSTMKVPTPAVQVTVVSPTGTPYRRLTVPYGMPVEVLNAEDTTISFQRFGWDHGNLHDVTH